MLRFSAFNQRTTPEINGEVSLISADITQDQRTGAKLLHGSHRGSRARARASWRRQARARHAGRGFIQTGERTVLSYLIKPLIDQALKAFREK